MTKDELHVVNAIEQRIRKEQERLERLKDWVEHITLELDGMPHENAYKLSSVAELTVQIVDCEKHIQELFVQRAQSRAELTKAIDDAIEDEDQKAVLVERYGFGLPFKRIAEKLHISEPNVFVFHRKGLKVLLNR